MSMTATDMTQIGQDALSECAAGIHYSEMHTTDTRHLMKRCILHGITKVMTTSLAEF